MSGHNRKSLGCKIDTSMREGAGRESIGYGDWCNTYGTDEENDAGNLMRGRLSFGRSHTWIIAAYMKIG